MGCDIHVRIECKFKMDGKWVWQDFTPVFKNPYYGKYEHAPEYEEYYIGGRWYKAFALLADVRNYGSITPISLAKGMPDDASEGVMAEYEKWGKDAHSHSYFTLMELEYYCNTHTEIIGEKDDDEPLYAKDLLKSYLQALQFVYNNIDPIDKNSIRMVFWFDN
ncbi:MAG: hypothetical protein IKW14_03225 [Phascolarctobacterium sp.]|nr:hypothetical protein [Phascolarctobacterium sp.]